LNAYQVVRDGKELEIEAREVVPGDIAIVEEGQTIPADGKVDETFHCP
jgi:H+-transporting ATPase